MPRNSGKSRRRGFVRANSMNLPLVDFDLYLGFLSEVNCSQETEVNATNNWKNRYASFNYGDNVVGWVQVKRVGEISTVRAKLCPEYKSNVRYFHVSIVINEDHGCIEGFFCSGCTNNHQNGCKHIALFLTWMNRKAAELNSRFTINYCVKPQLMRHTKSTKGTMTSADPNLIDNLSNQMNGCHLDGNKNPPLNGIDNVSAPVLNCSINFSLDNYFGEKSPKQFLQYLSNFLAPDICCEIEEKTRLQSSCQLWFDMKYGRISGSTIYKAAKSSNSTYLLSTIFNYKTNESYAMRRGKGLEIPVLKVVESKLGQHIRRSGIVLNKNYPAFGVSADGIGDEFVVEIKCPTKTENISRFYNNDEIQPQYKAQIQLQMLLNNKSYGYFVIADPKFEINHHVEIYREEFDPGFIVEMMDRAMDFWKEKVFPNLFS